MTNTKLNHSLLWLLTVFLLLPVSNVTYGENNCYAELSVSDDRKPGKILAPTVTITKEGNPTVDTVVLFINDQQRPSVIWDGRETKVEVQVSCDGRAAKTISIVVPAFSPPAPDNLPECVAEIGWQPQNIKPGDQLNPVATVTSVDGKPVQGYYGGWVINGKSQPNVIWDGNETKIEYQLTCPGHDAHSFVKTIPAYGLLPANGLETIQLPELPGLNGIGNIPGPKSAVEAIVGVLAPGLIAIFGGLLSGLFGNPLPKQLRPSGSSTEDSNLSDDNTSDTVQGSPPSNTFQSTSPPADIEYTSPDGRNTVLVYHPEYGGYINSITGGLVNPSDIDRWKQTNVAIQKGVNDFRIHNADLVSTHQDAQSQALQAIQNQAMELKKNQAALVAANNKYWSDRIVSKLGNDPNLGQDLKDAAARGDIIRLQEIYKGKIGADMMQSRADANHQNTMATIYGAGEIGAKVVVAASKGALIAIGGPAGMVVTGTMTGAISAAQAGASGYVNGDSVGQIVGKTAVGFITGFKDGAVGIYTNMPGVSTAAIYGIPAGLDTAQTFVQTTINDPSNITGNLGKALECGALSLGSTYLGGKVDSSMTGAGKEIVNLGLGTAGGAVGAVIQGGDPGEGALEGFIGAVGGRIGGHLGTKASNQARSGEEQVVTSAIHEGDVARNENIPLADQPQIIKDLRKTMGKGENLGPDGKKYVDPKGALDQLRDTQSSRTVKQGPDDIKEAITNTRKDKIYEPADKATIDKVTPELVAKGIIKEGEKTVMDSFSTPGKKVTGPGADRDARLVVERIDPETGKTVKVEIPREHWENQAYKDFHDTTVKMAGGKEAITPEKYPDYHKRVENITKNNTENLTREQIEHRAWAEEHNQVFTDKNHIEASKDNSDQITKIVNGQEVQTQGKANVELVKAGQATLKDPADFARMWHEKSDVYSKIGNQPEAIAQSQKGIESYSKIRDGYHKLGYEVPPIDAPTAKAMEIISKAPVGVDATPVKMAEVNQQLKDLGFKDVNDALGKVAMENEKLAYAIPKTGLSTSSTINISVGSIADEQRMETNQY